MGSDNTVPLWSSCRYAVAYLGFFGAASIYMMRVNFSVAIVCMTFDPVDNSSATEYEDYPSLSWILGNHEEVVCSDNTNITTEETGEFDWDRQLRGTLTSSFFWGYILTQFVGGWLGARFGGKHIVTFGVSVSVLSSFLSPPAARLSPYALVAMRFINGLGQGVFFPAYYCLAGYWFPLKERAVLMAIYGTGTTFGSIISLALSGLICAQLGWQWVFYIYSICGAICVVVWHLLVYETPGKHPRITEAEKKYIEATISPVALNKRPVIPWRGLLTDPAVWCFVVCDFCSGWAFYAGLTQLPQYMEDVLQVDITKNGIYSSLPQVTKFVFSFIFAYLGDFLLIKEVMKVLTVRRVMSSIAMLVPMCFVIGVGYLDCSTAALAIVFLVLQEGFVAANRAGFPISRIDVAPKFSGIILGITNTAGNIPGMVSPIVISSITTDGTRAQWQIVFFMSAGMYLTAWLSFMIFGKSEEQDWAKVDDEMEMTIKVSAVDLTTSDEMLSTEHNVYPEKPVPYDASTLNTYL